VDTAAMQVTAGAGVTLARWREHARAAALDAPVDFAARDSATIGGAIATNAGGSRVLRFGTMRSQVAGIEAVLADGSVVGSLAGLPKETAGLHWPSLVAGSEGTLAIVTRARLRLVPWFREAVTAMIPIDGLDAAVDLLDRLRRTLTSLDSAELVHADALALVSAHLGRRPPVDLGPDGVAVIVECAAHDDPTDELAAALEAAA
ncbi:MAG: FAD-binding oxidoreductase, partial [Myxococcales bacterium]|nr:FAD-binding oxidoreductase [Myxococcales bacterium]